MSHWIKTIHVRVEDVPGERAKFISSQGFPELNMMVWNGEQGGLPIAKAIRYIYKRNWKMDVQVFMDTSRFTYGREWVVLVRGENES